MKNVLKIFGILAAVLFIGAYIYFLKFLPGAVDLNVYIPEIQKIVKENTGLDANIGSIKLVTTPVLGIGAKIDDISVSLPDKSNLLKLSGLKAKISLPNLIFLNVRISDITLYKPVINLEIENGKEFKAIKAIEGLLLENEKKQALPAVKNEGFNIFSLVTITAPSIKILNYKAYISDLLSGEYLLLEGDLAKLGYFNGKRAKVQTQAKLYLNSKKQLDIDVNFDSFIPKTAELDKEDDPAVRAEVPFINPVLTYKSYDPKGDISAKIKLSEKDIHGFFTLENLTLNIEGYKIPKSYVRAKFFGNKILTDSDIFLAPDRHFKILGKIKNLKKPDVNLDIFSTDVYFNDLISLSKGVLDSLNIPNNLADIKGEGSFNADLHIKTAAKSLKSRGRFEVKEGAVVNKKAGLGLRNINALVLLDDNSIKIDSAKVKINDGEINFTGGINKKAEADIRIKANSLPIPELFYAFAPGEVKSQFNFISGTLSFDAKITGKIKNAVSIFMTKIDNLKISDKLGTLVISNKAFNFDANNTKKLAGKLTNSGLEISLPYSNSAIKNDSVEILFDDKNLVLSPTQFKINKKSALTLSGSIENYVKRPILNFIADGNLYADELKALLGVVVEPFVESRGVIPFKLSFSGNSKKQTLRAQIIADSKNYITPINIKSILNNQTIAQLLVDFKGNRVKIKNTGLYSKLVPSEFSDDFDANMTDTSEVAALEGTIMGIDSNNPVINMLKFNINKPLEINLTGFKNSSLIFGGKLSMYGNTDSPRYKGNFTVDNVFIPDMALDMKQAKLQLNGKDGEINTDGFIINGSDLKISSNIDLSALPLISLYNLKVNSNSLDVDKLTEVSSHVLSMIPDDPVQKPKSDIMALINSGNFDIKAVKTGNINVQNLTGNLALAKNILYADKIYGEIFGGDFGGNVDVDLLDFIINAVINGKNMDTNEALIVLANMKDTLTGKLSFDTNVSLAGLTFDEQIKSLAGTFNFLIEDGQAGPFSKIENIFLSENLRESEFFQSAMGSVISSAVSIDTSRFSTLKGTINFKKDGIAYIDPITMQGNALCIKIAGDMDVLKNTLDAKVRGRLGSMVDSVLGPLSNLNPVNIVKATPGLNVVLAKTFSVFCEKVTNEEMNSIPDFSKDRSDLSATKFQLVLRGDVAKPLGLLKSFKWLVTEDEYNMAENFVSSIPDELPEGVNTLEEMQVYEAELAAKEAENKTLKGKIKNLFKKKESV